MTDQQFSDLMTVLNAINTNLTALNERIESLVEPVTADKRGPDIRGRRVDVPAIFVPKCDVCSRNILPELARPRLCATHRRGIETLAALVSLQKDYHEEMERDYATGQEYHDCTAHPACRAALAAIQAAVEKDQS